MNKKYCYKLDAPNFWLIFSPDGSDVASATSEHQAKNTTNEFNKLLDLICDLEDGTNYLRKELLMLSRESIERSKILAKLEAEVLMLQKERNENV